jgi:hypothetical protein
MRLVATLTRITDLLIADTFGSLNSHVSQASQETDTF